jgi:hypothetical protein
MMFFARIQNRLHSFLLERFDDVAERSVALRDDNA